MKKENEFSCFFLATILSLIAYIKPLYEPIGVKKSIKVLRMLTDPRGAAVSGFNLTIAMKKRNLFKIKKTLFKIKKTLFKIKKTLFKIRKKNSLQNKKKNYLQNQKNFLQKQKNSLQN